jgi:hypothetical protein
VLLAGGVLQLALFHELGDDLVDAPAVDDA